MRLVAAPSPSPASASASEAQRWRSLLELERQFLEFPALPPAGLVELRSALRAALISSFSSSELIESLPAPALTFAQRVRVNELLGELVADLRADRPRPTVVAAVVVGVASSHQHTYALWLLGSEIARVGDVSLCVVDEQLARVLAGCVRSVIPTPPSPAARQSLSAPSPLLSSEAGRLVLLMMFDRGAFGLFPEDSAAFLARALAAAPAAVCSV